MKQDIYSNGPIQATFIVYQDMYVAYRTCDIVIVNLR